jgi:hypothetical protein
MDGSQRYSSARSGGAEQVAGAIGRVRSSVLMALFDLAVNADVRY